MADETISKMRKKHFVIICSYENVKQLYPESPDTNSKGELIKKHRKQIRVPLSIDECIIEKDNITLLVLPFNKHNHHSAIFLRARDEHSDPISSGTVITAVNTKISKN